MLLLLYLPTLLQDGPNAALVGLPGLQWPEDLLQLQLAFGAVVLVDVEFLPLSAARLRQHVPDVVEDHVLVSGPTDLLHPPGDHLVERDLALSELQEQVLVCLLQSLLDPRIEVLFLSESGLDELRHLVQGVWLADHQVEHFLRDGLQLTVEQQVGPVT